MYAGEVLILLIQIPSPLPETNVAYFTADFVDCENDAEVNHRVKQTHSRTVTPLELFQAFSIDKGGNYICRIVNSFIIEKDDLLITNAHKAAHSQNQGDYNCWNDAG